MTALPPDLLDLLLDEHQASTLPRLERLWDYYRNPLDADPHTDAHTGTGATHGRWYSLGQERGLPERLTGDGADDGLSPPREIVIENDIAWRIHSLVDFMFGKGVTLQSTAPDPARAAVLGEFLRQAFNRAGGVSFFQDLALLGAVYGYVDVLVRITPSDDAPSRDSMSRASSPTQDLRLVKPRLEINLEIIEPPRAVPLLRPDDYRKLDAYAVHYTRLTHEVETAGLLARVRSRLRLSAGPSSRRGSLTCTEVWTAETFERFECAEDSSDRRRVEQSVNPLGRVPVVHIQNLAQPFFYEGLSEVEPLIPLQDELNIRLSDRANRVTFQSFKMYLGKGLEGFLDKPVGPGQMWATDNEQASIEEFGGDASSPSEESHIAQLREALDKTSAVTAVAAGLIQDRVGNLTSEAALRITLMGLLAKTQKKRVTYGAGIERICELVLHAADVAGVLPNSPDERAIRLDWPNPLPEDPEGRLREAKLKLDIGVPRRQVLTELGYAEVE